MINTVKCVCSNTQELIVVGLQSITIRLSLWSRTQNHVLCNTLHSIFSMVVKIRVKPRCLFPALKSLFMFSYFVHDFICIFVNHATLFSYHPSLSLLHRNLKENKTSLWCAVYIDFCILNSIYLRFWKLIKIYIYFFNLIIR